MEANPRSRPDGEPTAGQQMPPPDGKAAYPYPSSSYPPAYPYGAPPPQQQQQQQPGGPVAAPPYYPYGAPAPQPPPPPQRSSEARCFSRCLCCFLSFILFFLIASLLLRLLINPYIPEVEVSSIAISGFVLSTSGHLFSGKFDLVLAVSNPRGDTRIHYDNIGVAVLYEEQVLAFTAIPPFLQDRDTTTNIKVHQMEADAKHLHGDKAEDMESERSEDGGHGNVSFQVRMFAYMRFSSVDDDWESSKYEMRAYCEDVLVGFSGRNAKGTFANGRPVRCRVDV